MGDKKTWWTGLEEGQAWEDSYYMASEKLTQTFYSLWLSPAFIGMTHCSQLNSWLKLRKGLSPFAVWIHVCNFCDLSIQGKNCFRFFTISCIISELRSHFVETVGTNFNKQKNKNRKACTASLISKPERMGLKWWEQLKWTTVDRSLIFSSCFPLYVFQWLPFWYKVASHSQVNPKPTGL